jgi:hypothetical protein
MIGYGCSGSWVTGGVEGLDGGLVVGDGDGVVVVVGDLDGFSSEGSPRFESGALPAEVAVGVNDPNLAGVGVVGWGDGFGEGSG